MSPHANGSCLTWMRCERSYEAWSSDLIVDQDLAWWQVSERGFNQFTVEVEIFTAVNLSESRNVSSADVDDSNATHANLDVLNIDDSILEVKGPMWLFSPRHI